MRIAYTTTFDATDVHQWSGTPYFMSRAFTEVAHVDYIGALNRQLPPFFKTKQIYKKYITGQRESPRFNIHAAKHYSFQVEQALKQRAVDIIVSPLINPIAYLDSEKPVVLWTDALYAGLLGFYSPFSAHSAKTVEQGNLVTTACLNRATLAFFSSDWAANSAKELYGIAREKIKVIPFGANIRYAPNYDEIKTIISNRAHDKIKLLFLAKSWERKGGDLVLAVTKALHEAGHAVELNIIGYDAKDLPPLPPYIKPLGFISKHTDAGQQKIQKLLSDTHFLFVPSRAEAYGIVFCEANAYAVPCLSTYVGGISTIIKDHINGFTFSLEAKVATYCDYIVTTMQDKKNYDALALSSFNEYATRLNWTSAVQAAKQYMQAVI
ncbi:MAG: glycosyltransferase family 4 protein [Gammaproteobacteria bacterium]|nr:glycosyltransferase family 4 protein [Gammaproteobacteria bacterium]